MTHFARADISGEADAKKISDEAVEAYGSEAAAAVLFLASDEESYITGGRLMVDGGYSAL